MSSLITRGYYRYNRVISRGYGKGWLGKFYAEILQFTSTFTKLINKISSFQKEMDGV